jgi:hypothetical protein
LNATNKMKPRYRHHTFEIQIIEQIQQQDNTNNRNAIDSSYLSSTHLDSSYLQELTSTLTGSSETLTSLRSLGIDTNSYESIRNLHNVSYVQGIENGYSFQTLTDVRFFSITNNRKLIYSKIFKGPVRI